MVRPLLTTASAQVGIRTVSKATDVSGSAQATTTLITVNDTAVLEEWQNQGVRKHAVRGDGRVWFSVLPNAPILPQVGDLWLQDVGGALSIRVHTASGTTSFDAGGGFAQVVAASALLRGHALRVNGSKVSYAAADVGTQSFRVLGLATETTNAADEGLQAWVTGDVAQLADWATVIGASALVPGARYYLSAVPGKLSTTPAVAVVAPVGTALDATRLLIQIERPIIR